MHDLPAMDLNLTSKLSRRNYRAFLWHSIFLALAKNFMDVDTVIPAMLIESGGTAIHVGLLTMIMVGGSHFGQLFFAPLLSNQSYKKASLLAGINIRVLALFGLGIMLLYVTSLPDSARLWMILLLLTLFSLGGSYAGICYTDILGKSILGKKRKTFFSIRQFIMGIGAFLSVLVVARMLGWKPYPLNYGFLFIGGSMGLLAASFGFWRIREVTPSRMPIRGIGHFISVIREEMEKNPRLKYFLGYINTLGMSMAFLPFVILYAKEELVATSADTGGFLFFKVIGSVATSLLIFLVARNVKYIRLQYFSAVIAMGLPAVLLLPVNGMLINLVFLAGGVIIAVYTITMNGIILELSNTENRAVYAGVSGAANILPVIFPLIGGWIIGMLGYTPFFLLYLLIFASSFYFIRKLKCSR